MLSTIALFRLDSVHSFVVNSQQIESVEFEYDEAAVGCLQCFDAVGWAAGRASSL